MEKIKISACLLCHTRKRYKHFRCETQTHTIWGSFVITRKRCRSRCLKGVKLGAQLVGCYVYSAEGAATMTTVMTRVYVRDVVHACPLVPFLSKNCACIPQCVPVCLFLPSSSRAPLPPRVTSAFRSLMLSLLRWCDFSRSTSPSCAGLYHHGWPSGLWNMSLKGLQSMHLKEVFFFVHPYGGEWCAYSHHANTWPVSKNKWVVDLQVTIAKLFVFGSVANHHCRYLKTLFSLKNRCWVKCF